METHGLKHHYLHHQPKQPIHQNSQQTNFHQHQNNHNNSLGSTQPYSFASGPNGQTNKIKFETSAAFPLLLSSIESGQNAFNGTTIFPKANSKDSLITNHVNNVASHVNQSASGQGNESSSSSSLLSSSSSSSSSLSQQSSTGSSHHNTNGVVWATPKLKSAATPNLTGRQLTTFGQSTNGHSQANSFVDEASSVTSLTPFNKNLIAREPINNNGVYNRNKTKSPNKENKNLKLANRNNHVSILANSVDVGSKRPSIRSPNTHNNPTNSNNNKCNQNGDDHSLLSTGSNSATNRTKVAKFFKEKSKEKVDSRKNVNQCNNNSSTKSGDKPRSNISKTKCSSNSVKSNDNKPTTKTVKLTKLSDNNNVDENGTAQLPKSPPSRQSIEAESVHRVINYVERLIDDFTFMCFDDKDSLEFSLKDALGRDITVLNYEECMPQMPGLIENQHGILDSTDVSPPVPTLPTSDPSVKFVLQKELPSSSSSESELEQTIVKSNRKSKNRTLSSKSDDETTDSKVIKSNKKKTSMKRIPKSKAIVDSEGSNDSDEEIDEDDEPAKKEFNNTVVKFKTKPRTLTVKCTHRRAKNKLACNRCVVLHNKSIGKTKPMDRFVDRKAKSKGKGKINVPTRNKKSITPKRKCTKKSSNHIQTTKDESDSSDEEQPSSEEGESSNDDEDDEISEVESDTTQEEDDDDEDDDDDDDECANRTIADLIKCSNRREAVRKAEMARARAEMASVKSRTKTNRTTAAGTTTTPCSTTNTNPVQSSSNLSSGPPMTNSADDDLSSVKKSKLKKMPNKCNNNRSDNVASSSKTAKTKRNANKRTNSDSDESKSSDVDETAEPLSSPRKSRSSIANRSASKLKNVRKSKSDNENDENDDDDDEDEDELSDSEPDESSKVNKRQKKTPRSNGKVAKNVKAINSNKRVKTKPKKVEVHDDSEDNADNDGSNSDSDKDSHSTDDESDKDQENNRTTKKTNGKNVKRSTDKKGKNVQVNNRKKAKPSVTNKKSSKGVKSEVGGDDKISSKRNVHNQSDDDTEQSEDESDHENEDVKSSPISRSQVNLKNKCDKTKVRVGHDNSTRTASATNVDQLKDVYTFELSPTEVPNNKASRLVLSSSNYEAKVHGDDKTDETLIKHKSDEVVVSTSISPSANVHETSLVSVKSSVSPRGNVNTKEIKEDAFEPLRTDHLSHFEPSFGPNSSLSSLSQLSQSIGGGGSGPILLNHQSSVNKCPINIKEEPREDHQALSRSGHNPKNVSIHPTPPPEIGDQCHPPQPFGQNFLANNKNAHTRRLWSNTSSGSLVSSSSSSSSSPVHPAFGQCPPTPATPASLANYFVPTNSLSGLASPSLYHAQNQEMIRRELDSRILASANDRNLLTSSLGMAPSSGSYTPITTTSVYSHSSTNPVGVSTSTTTTVNPLMMPQSIPPFIQPPNSSSYYANPLNPHLYSNAFMHGNNAPFRPFGNPVFQTSTNSKDSRSSNIERPPSQTSSSKEIRTTPIKLEKVKWSTMHLTIAKNIHQAMTEQLKNNNINNNNNNNGDKSGNKNITKPNKSPLKPIEPSNGISQPICSKPHTSTNKGLSDYQKDQNASISASSTHRPASATTFNNHYPPRYSTPFGTPSISAPPFLPGLFPSNIPSPMHLPGFMPESWPRPPVSMGVPLAPPPPTPPPPPPPGVSNAIRQQYSLPDFYTSVNSASSALSAWAAGIKPPPTDPMVSANIHSNPNDHNVKPSPTPTSNSSQQLKRKHDDSNRDRNSTSKHSSSSHSSYKNGEVYFESPKKKHHHSSSSSSSSSTSKSHKNNVTPNNTTRTNSIENGERQRHESVCEPSKPKHDNRHLNVLPNANATPSSPYTGPMFGNTNMFNEQRYLELLGIPTSVSHGMSSTNSCLPGRNNVDISSRPLWPFNMPPPPGPSTGPGITSTMMADPFKSLQDISLRPGLVTPDRETLFSRYSMLSSSGGGASIFDKVNKDQLDKYEMMQNQGKTNVPSGATISNQQKQSVDSMSSSRTTPNHRVPIPPPSSSLPPTTAPRSSTSTPFPYPSPYLSPLNHLNSLSHLAAPSSSYVNSTMASLQQPMGHVPPFGITSNPMVNGDLSKFGLGAHHGHLSHGLTNGSSQFMLPPHFPPPPPPGSNMTNYMNHTSSTTPSGYNPR